MMMQKQTVDLHHCVKNQLSVFSHSLSNPSSEEKYGAAASFAVAPCLPRLALLFCVKMVRTVL